MVLWTHHINRVFVDDSIAPGEYSLKIYDFYKCKEQTVQVEVFLSGCKKYFDLDIDYVNLVLSTGDHRLTLMADPEYIMIAKVFETEKC